MPPSKSLPYSDAFASADAYVEALLHYVATTPIFQTLCGGVHIMDFYAADPGLFYSIVPADWQAFLLDCEPTELLEFLLRDDVEHGTVTANGRVPPPASLIQYVCDVRRLSLQRTLDTAKVAELPRKITMGMNVKKVHEVTHFSAFVSDLADNVAATHLVDVGSGQNYLGRVLASPPYGRRPVVAVEGRGHNIAGARELDVRTGVAVATRRPLRNKKLYQQLLHERQPEERQNEKVRNRLARGVVVEAVATPSTDSDTTTDAHVELRPWRALDLEAVYRNHSDDDSPPILYVEGRLENGDLSGVLAQVPSPAGRDLRFLAVSIHSCGNLSHYGLRALTLNPTVQAVAIVGCCYNLLTERLGPPTYKLPGLSRPSLQPVNGRVVRESERRDPEGFPMSERLSAYKLPDSDETGIRFNITARMMACQAPQNWTAAESAVFFRRHFFRAVLQRIFLDRGVLQRVGAVTGDSTDDTRPVSPIIVGSLAKACYVSLPAYVRGAVAKIAAQGNGNGAASAAQNAKVNAAVAAQMAGLTDAELDDYAAKYAPRLRELSAVWSLMAFSAGLVESAIVVDRWQFLREQTAVTACWVESVFAYAQSPRNLVVVGIKG